MMPIRSPLRRWGIHRSTIARDGASAVRTPGDRGRWSHRCERFRRIRFGAARPGHNDVEESQVSPNTDSPKSMTRRLPRPRSIVMGVCLLAATYLCAALFLSKESADRTTEDLWRAYRDSSCVRDAAQDVRGRPAAPGRRVVSVTWMCDSRPYVENVAGVPLAFQQSHRAQISAARCLAFSKWFPRSTVPTCSAAD